MTNIKSLFSHSEATDGNKAKTSHSAFSDFVDAAVISGVEDPINAGEQLINHATGKHLPKIELVDRPGNTWAAKAGSIVGGLVDVAVISVGVASGVAEVGLAAGVGTSILSSAGVGLIYSATRPTSEKGNFWLNKGRDVAITTGTFAAFGALAPGMDKCFSFLGKSGSRSLIQDVAANGLSGFPAGAINAELTSVLYGRGMASASDLYSKSLQFALYGAALGFSTHVIQSAIADGKSAIENSNNDATESAVAKPTVHDTNNDASDLAAGKTANESAKVNEVTANPLTKFNNSRRGFDIQFDDQGNVSSLQYQDPDGAVAIQHLVTPVKDPETGNILWRDDHTVHVDDRGWGQPEVLDNPNDLHVAWQSPVSHAMMRPSKVEVLADPPFQIDADGKGITLEGQPIARTLLDMQYQMHRKAPTEMLSWTETAKTHMRLGDYNSEVTTTGAPSQDEIDGAIEKAFPYGQHLDDGEVREANIGNGLVVHQHFSLHDDPASLITTKLFNLFPQAQHLTR
jgi:hypothetical protein